MIHCKGQWDMAGLFSCLLSLEKCGGGGEREGLSRDSKVSYAPLV